MALDGNGELKMAVNKPKDEPKAPTPESSCELGIALHGEFLRARDERASITDGQLLDCLRLRKGVYSADEAIQIGSIKTFINATSVKCRALEAWLDDILSSARERFWTITPTPIPSPPEFVRDLIVAQIKKEVIALGASSEDDKSGRIDEYIRTRADSLKDLSITDLNIRAKKAADKMAVKIDDQLTEAGFKQEFAAFRTDLATFPYAVMKGPIIRNKKRLQWVGSAKTPEVIEEPQLCVERVDPFDFYWTSWSTNPNQGMVFHRMRMQQSSLYDCIGLPGFCDDKLREALQMHANGYREEVQTDNARERLQYNTNLTLRNSLIDVIDTWGTVSGQMLKDWGFTGTVDMEAQYEINAWTIAGVCVRVVLNPDKLGKRIFYVTAFEKIPGSMVGRSPPMLMKPHQEIINSSYRSLRRNMGLASGPFAEVDANRIADGQAPEEIMPAMVKLVDPDISGNGQPAYRFHNIDSHASELLAVIAAEKRECDDATGIPAYSYGNAASSGVGRTVGGLAMLMGNASKGVKKVLGHVEDDFLTPFLTSMYNYNMQFDPDESIKVDAQIIAQGPSGIIMRETTTQKRLEALQLITPYVQAGVVPKSGIEYMLREVLKGLDMDVDKIIPDPDTQATLQGVVQGLQQQGTPKKISTAAGDNVISIDAGQGSTPPPQGRGQVKTAPGGTGVGTTPMAVPDGRSGQAAQFA
jgi:hypothetical protein